MPHCIFYQPRCYLHLVLVLVSKCGKYSSLPPSKPTTTIILCGASLDRTHAKVETTLLALAWSLTVPTEPVPPISSAQHCVHVPDPSGPQETRSNPPKSPLKPAQVPASVDRLSPRKRRAPENPYFRSQVTPDVRMRSAFPPCLTHAHPVSQPNSIQTKPAQPATHKKNPRVCNLRKSTFKVLSIPNPIPLFESTFCQVLLSIESTFYRVLLSIESTGDTSC